MFDFNKLVPWINLLIIIGIKPSAFKQNDTITSKVGQLDYFFEDSIVVILYLYLLAILYTYIAIYLLL